MHTALWNRYSQILFTQTPFLKLTPEVPHLHKSARNALKVTFAPEYDGHFQHDGFDSDKKYNKNDNDAPMFTPSYITYI